MGYGQVAMHYWDFVIDAEEYGGFWAERSEIFHDDWFGSSEPGVDVNHVISKGRWARTRKSEIDESWFAAPVPKTTTVFQALNITN